MDLFVILCLEIPGQARNDSGRRFADRPSTSSGTVGDDALGVGGDVILLRPSSGIGHTGSSTSAGRGRGACRR